MSPTHTQIEIGVPCCPEFRQLIANRHGPFAYRPATRDVVAHDSHPGTGLQLISYCPMCGSRLLPSLDGERDEVAIEQGLEPDRLDDTASFADDRWWRTAQDADPRAFSVLLPLIGSQLDIARHRLLVIGVDRRPDFEKILLATSEGSAFFVTSTRAYSQGRWPVVAHDPSRAGVLGSRIRLTQPGVGRSSRYWVLGTGEDFGIADSPLIVDESETIYSVVLAEHLDRVLP